MKSLRDQLVESGLATASQARKAERQAKAEKQARKRRSDSDPPKAQGRGARKGGADKAADGTPTAQDRARQARAAKARRDREIAQARNSKAAARALRAEIKQIIAQNDQRDKTTREDDVPYNFSHNRKIKRIYLPRAQVESLARGQLVIVNNDGLYHLVTREVADRIAERAPGWIVGAKEEDQRSEPEEMDDYYKQFEVPDDLDW